MKLSFMHNGKNVTIEGDSDDVYKLYQMLYNTDDDYTEIGVSGTVSGNICEGHVTISGRDILSN